MGERIKINTKKPLSTKKNSAHNKQKTGFRSQSSHVDRILFLQRTIGNQAVQRLIKSGTLQTKLKIGQQGDKYEQEADRVADAVMQMPEPQVQRQTEQEEEKLQAKTMAEQITPLVQRQIETEEEEEEIIQTERANRRTPQVGHSLEAQIHHLRGGGQPLSTPTRAFFEPRFSYDFSQVRVHTDSKAVEAAGSVKAKAFTIGREVVFSSGNYSPNTFGGRQLLAHELTHVIQQQGRQQRIQRVTDDVVECNRNGAPACLVHLHGNETEALNVAVSLYRNHCLNLVHIGNPGRRKVHVDVSVNLSGGGTRTFACCADPNRIFSNAGIDAGWRNWNNGTRQMCNNSLCCVQHQIAAKDAIRAFRDNTLLPAINRCREGAGNVSEINAGTSVTGRPVIAFHNNTQTPNPTTTSSLSIHSYIGNSATTAIHTTSTQDQRLLQIAYDQLCQNPSINQSDPPNPRLCTGIGNLRNPHIQTDTGPNRQDPDDFILVTNPYDFVAFVRQGRNVVLQAAAPTDDGSLSVLLKRERYINVEAQRGRGNEQEIMGRQAVETALSLRGGGPPCTSAPRGGCPY